MPYPINEIKPNLRNTLNAIEASIYKSIKPLRVTIWKTSEPVSFEERTKGEEKEVSIGDSWGEIWDCAWFHFEGEVPNVLNGKK
jgi:alpha-mannosidase